MKYTGVDGHVYGGRWAARVLARRGMETWTGRGSRAGWGHAGAGARSGGGEPRRAEAAPGWGAREGEPGGGTGPP
jgi:hypothetical protein